MKYFVRKNLFLEKDLIIREDSIVVGFLNKSAPIFWIIGEKTSHFYFDDKKYFEQITIEEVIKYKLLGIIQENI